MLFATFPLLVAILAHFTLPHEPLRVSTVTGTLIGLTAGIGFRSALDGVRYHVDYAWADQGRLEDTHRFSFGLLF